MFAYIRENIFFLIFEEYFSLSKIFPKIKQMFPYMLNSSEVFFKLIAIDGTLGKF